MYQNIKKSQTYNQFKLNLTIIFGWYKNKKSHKSKHCKL